MKIFRRNINLGRKVPVIDTPDLRDKCVTTGKLADGSVTTNKIADGAITREKIADKAITNLDNVVQEAQDTADHPTLVGEDNYVYFWNKQTHSYNKTSIYVRGEGFHVSKTFDSVADMEAYTGTDLKEGDFVLIQSTPDDPDNAKLYTYSGTQGVYNYLVNMSGALGFTGKTPQFSIGSIITIEPTEQASASLSPDGTDSDGNPKYKLNLALPKGEKGTSDFVIVDDHSGAGDDPNKIYIPSANAEKENATAIANEVTRATSAEQTNATAITTEETRAKAAEQVNATAIANEVTRARAAEQENATAIGGIEEKIPTQATAQNKLADKEFVNSSISTATADFKGTYNSLADLQAVVGANANDYGYVIATDAAGNTVYKKYKYVTGTGWVFEYDLNNSSFTAEQWATIQSGMTSALTSKLADLPTNTALQDALTTIRGSVTTEETRAKAAEQVNATAIANEVTRARAAEQENATTIANEVTRATEAEQTNATAIAAEEARARAAEADRYTKSETYTKTEVNDLVDTPHQEYVTVDAYSNLPATGSKDTIYRVSNYNGSTSQADVSAYSEYAWNGSQYIFLCVKAQIGEVFDISVYNNNTKYADLAAALNGGANIPLSLQKGGMSVKFVQSSDNKYVQYMYKGTSTSAADFTNTAYWEKMNLEEEVSQLGQYINKFNVLTKHNGWIGASAYSYVESGDGLHVVVPCNTGDNVHIKANNLYACLLYVVKSYTAPVTNGETPDFVSGEDARRVVQNTLTLDFTAPSGTQYLVVGYQLNDGIYTPAEFTINGYNILEDIRENINDNIERIKDNTERINDNATHIKTATYSVYGTKKILNISSTYTPVALNEIIPKGCVLTDIGAYAGDLWLVDTQSNSHRVRGVPFVLTTDISSVIVSTAGTISLTFSAINDVFNTVSEYKSEDFAFGYYNTDSVSIGDYLPVFRTYENIAALMISVKAGDVITSKFQNNNSNEYCRGWILTDKDKKILSWSAEGNLDYLTNPLEQTITNDGYLIVQHQPVTSLSSVLISQDRRVINLNETIKEESKKTVQDYIEEQGISKDTVQICLPDKIYAVAGDKLQLFYRGFIKAVNPYNYDIKITCSVGQQFPRYYQYAPAAAASNRTDDLLVQVKNNAGKILAEKTIQIITCSAPVSPDEQRHVLIFGDSLTAKGQWAAEAYRRLVGNGGNPAGKQLTNISFDGAMVKDGAGYFGIGGWTWNDYETNISGFRFQVSGVTALNNGDSYICNGSTFTLAENNTTDGVGEIMMIRIAGSASPDISGSLQRVSGVGDEIINYSSWSEDVGNPLWDSANNKMSFIPYANLYSDGKIDVVYVPLGGNSVQAWQTNFNAMKTAVKKFVDTLHAEFPNAKCKIVGLEIPSVRGGAGGNIATGVRLSDQYGMTNGVMNMNMFYQEFANSSETSGTSGDAYNTFVEYVDIASQFDTEYNMPHEMVDVNSRNSVDKEWRDTNQLHPADCGYMQIADVIYRNFVANYCQSE